MSIQEIKQRLSILTVLNHYGQTTDGNGMMCCPFHADKKASMKIYLRTNTAYCFAGSCKIESLDVIDYIMKMEKCTKHEAILKAKQLITGEIQNAPRIIKSSIPASKQENKNKAFNRYLKSLATHHEAKAYCEARGLNWRILGIGYKSIKTKEAWGRGCIIFPLKNENGDIVGLYGRGVNGSGHYYEKNRSGLYPGYLKSSTRIVVLCESIIDTATLLPLDCMEEYGLLALFGTNGLGEEHKAAISLVDGLEEIVLLLDGDEAGRAATEEHGKTLEKLRPGVKISRVDLPEGEDVNSMAVGHENREELFMELMQNRKVVNEVKKVKIVKSMLETSNPNNLMYQTVLAMYYIKGGVRYTAKDFEHMKITLVIENKAGRKSRQKLDMYEDKQVEKVSRIAGEKLDLRPDLIELDLQKLTDELETHREEKHLAGLKKEEVEKPVPVKMKSKCLALLQKNNLLKELNKLIGKAGITGEEVNRLLLFVVASSYKMPETLHALIQGASGSGKTRLLRVISELMPEEEVKRYTRVTDGSFYNQGEYYFKNKLLCFEDIDGLKEDALLAVRELQSNEILITSTSVKDEHGRISGGERIVRGPIGSISCTTKGHIYEDNISRCFVVAVDESKEQSLRIIKYQNEKSAGIIDKKKEQEIRTFLQNCIRMLKPYEVINPYANKIHLPEDAHKIRRLNELYQSFVKQVTLLNQYQRKKDGQGRLITEKEDLEVACEILFESIVLKVDELDGSLRQFFEKLKTYVKSKGTEYEFNRFEIRKITGVSKTQQHYYITRLIEMEYLRQWGFANRGYRYKIAHWDDMGALRKRIKTDLEKQLKSL